MSDPLADLERLAQRILATNPIHPIYADQRKAAEGILSLISRVREAEESAVEMTRLLHHQDDNVAMLRQRLSEATARMRTPGFTETCGHYIASRGIHCEYTPVGASMCEVPDCPIKAAAKESSHASLIEREQTARDIIRNHAVTAIAPMIIPPCGEAVWDTFADTLTQRLQAEAKAEPAAGMPTRDWVDCPVCGQPDMRKETDAEGNALIFCVNHACASNSGNNKSALQGSSVPATAEIEEIAKRVAITPPGGRIVVHDGNWFAACKQLQARLALVEKDRATLLAAITGKPAP